MLDCLDSSGRLQVYTIAAAQVAELSATQRLMLVNVGLALVILGFTAWIAVALVRRNMRQRVEAERLAAMGTATARILHQIKNPLQTILLHADAGGQPHGGGPGVAAGDLPGDRDRGDADATELLADLSAYASGGQRRLHPGPLPLNELLTETARTEAREAAVSGIDVAIGPVEPLRW